MGVNKKGKRKIIVSDRTYYWYIKDEPLCPHTSNVTVYIVSDDRKFAVHYILNSDFVAIEGRDFHGRPDNGCTCGVM